MKAGALLNGPSKRETPERDPAEGDPAPIPDLKTN